MRRPIAFIFLVLGLLTIFGGCRKKTPVEEAQETAKTYFSALEGGNVELAYDYLCDRSFMLKSPDGEAVQLAPRPDLETYKSLMVRAPKVTVNSIEPRPDLSNEEEILVFEVVGLPHTGNLTQQRFLAYMGRNTKGDWSIILPIPVTPQPIESGNGIPGDTF